MGHYDIDDTCDGCGRKFNSHTNTEPMYCDECDEAISKGIKTDSMISYEKFKKNSSKRNQDKPNLIRLLFKALNEYTKDDQEERRLQIRMYLESKKKEKKEEKMKEKTKDSGLKKCFCCGTRPKHVETEWTDHYSCRCGFSARTKEDWNETIAEKGKRAKFRERLDKLIKKFFSETSNIVELHCYETISDDSYEAMKKLYAVLEKAMKK